jgi:hypothetical protein
MVLRLRRLVLLLAKYLYLGLVYAGSWSATIPVGELLGLTRSITGAGCEPASGHPERLVPDRPLSEVEQGLWRQLPL